MRFKKTKIFSCVILVIILGGLFTLTRGIEEGKNIEINNIDISKLKDGTYRGKYSKGRWISEVEVKVIDNEIKGIKTLSKSITPDISDELSKKIIKNQRIDVDVVSGATVTSKAYLKSVENALNK